MNDESLDLILVKKLTKVIEEFLRNHFLKSYGYSKKRLDVPQNDADDGFGEAEEEGEYYYDEEVPAGEQATPNQQLYTTQAAVP